MLINHPQSRFRFIAISPNKSNIKNPSPYYQTPSIKPWGISNMGTSHHHSVPTKTIGAPILRLSFGDGLYVPLILYVVLSEMVYGSRFHYRWIRDVYPVTIYDDPLMICNPLGVSMIYNSVNQWIIDPIP